MGKGKIIFSGILLLVFGCTNMSKEPLGYGQIVEIIVEKTEAIASVQAQSIGSPTIVEFIANDLDYNRYESANAKEEYYSLTVPKVLLRSSDAGSR